MLDRSACAVFSQGKPHEVSWLIRHVQEIEGSPSYSQSFTARLNQRRMESTVNGVCSQFRASAVRPSKPRISRSYLSYLAFRSIFFPHQSAGRGAYLSYLSQSAFFFRESGYFP